MLLIYPFSITDDEQALKNAEWIGELGGCGNHDAVVLADRRCDADLTNRITGAFKKTFAQVHLRMTQADIDGWPQGANHMFGFITALIENNAQQWPYFLWLEPDAIPMVPEWMDALEAEYKASKKVFMGEKVDLGEKRPDVPIHMSGVGIYPNPIVRHAGECCRAHDVAWDIAAKDQILPKAHFTKAIQHYWKHGTFTTLDGVRPGVVVFHSSKDGSLIDLLRNKGGDATSTKNTKMTSSAAPTVPSAGAAIKILPHNGIWVLEGDTIISEHVEKQGRLDFDSLIPYVLKHIRPGDTVVDVGAFIGDHTVAYSDAVGPSGKVLAYEPNPVAYQCLIHNVDKCGNVFTFSHALSDKREVVELTDLPNAASNYIGAGGRHIHTRTLDEDMSLFGQVDLIKIDVEGYELHVLKGMEQILARFHPKLVVEINEIALARQDTDAQTVISWIVRQGYEASILHRHKDAIFYDLLCLPAAKPPETVSDEPVHTSNQGESATPVAAPSGLATPQAVLSFSRAMEKEASYKPTIKEEVEWHVGVLKQFCESSPQTKSLVMMKLVYAGLRKPNKTKDAKHKTNQQTNGKRGAASEKCPF